MFDFGGRLSSKRKRNIKYDFRIFGSAKIKSQEMLKLHTNNTDISKTEFIYNNLIYT